jgi:hypothetical protein
MPKTDKIKVELSISLDQMVLDYIKNNHKNRSKFIEYCIIQELIKFEKYKNKLEICQNENQ